MARQPATTGSGFLSAAGDFRWVRVHVSMFAVGVVLLVSLNLLMGGATLWSLTATGIWSLLLIVHLILVAIARLSAELLAEDDEEVVLLPINDAVIVDPLQAPDPTATWISVQPAEAAPDQDETTETVSWQIATDVAQAKRQTIEPQEDEST